MTTQTSQFFLKFLNAIGSALQQFKMKFYHRHETSQKRNTTYAFAEKTDADNKNKSVVLVEIESFSSDPSKLQHNPHQTQEGEDPNLRITHTPSNRLH